MAHRLLVEGWQEELTLALSLSFPLAAGRFWDAKGDSFLGGLQFPKRMQCSWSTKPELLLLVPEGCSCSEELEGCSWFNTLGAIQSLEGNRAPQSAARPALPEAASAAPSPAALLNPAGGKGSVISLNIFIWGRRIWCWSFSVVRCWFAKFFLFVCFLNFCVWNIFLKSHSKSL